MGSFGGKTTKILRVHAILIILPEQTHFFRNVACFDGITLVTESTVLVFGGYDGIKKTC